MKHVHWSRVLAGVLGLLLGSWLVLRFIDEQWKAQEDEESRLCDEALRKNPPLPGEKGYPHLERVCVESGILAHARSMRSECTELLMGGYCERQMRELALSRESQEACALDVPCGRAIYATCDALFDGH